MTVEREEFLKVMGALASVGVVYDILCKLEKWDNLLGNTPQIPTPGGKNGTTEDFTRPS